jgi:hypothetical protein
MKKLLSIILFVGTTAAAQTDTSRLLIRLNFMQQHIAYMGAELSQRNTLQDKRLHDTLAARIGNGTSPTTVVAGSYPAGYVLKFFEAVAREEAGVAYTFLRELINGRSGYVGILNQLNTMVTNGDLVALWLRTELLDLLKRKEAVMTEKQKGGADWLKTPLE